MPRPYARTTRAAAKRADETFCAAVAERKKYTALCEHWRQMQDDMVRVAHARLMRDPCRELYLYVVPAHAGQWGSLHVIDWTETPPDGARLATPERIPGDDIAGIHRWLARFSGQLPVLGEEAPQ